LYINAKHSLLLTLTRQSPGAWVGVEIFVGGIVTAWVGLAEIERVGACVGVRVEIFVGDIVGNWVGLAVVGRLVGGNVVGARVGAAVSGTEGSADIVGAVVIT
jgi:hypothetical protein